MTSDSGTIQDYVQGTGTSTFTYDFKVLELGLGYRHEISQGLDFVAGASYLKAKHQLDAMIPDIGPHSLSKDENGYFGKLGIRLALTPDVELGGFVTHMKLTDLPSQTGVSGYLTYFLTYNWAAKVTAAIDDDSHGYGVGVSYNF